MVLASWALLPVLAPAIAAANCAYTFWHSALGVPPPPAVVLPVPPPVDELPVGDAVVLDGPATFTPLLQALRPSNAVAAMAVAANFVRIMWVAPGVVSGGELIDH